MPDLPKLIELVEGYDNQNGLLRALNSNLSNEEYDDILAFSRKAAGELGIQKTLRENEVDVIIGPGGSTNELYCCGSR